MLTSYQLDPQDITSLKSVAKYHIFVLIWRQFIWKSCLNVSTEIKQMKNQGVKSQGGFSPCTIPLMSRAETWVHFTNDVFIKIQIWQFFFLSSKFTSCLYHNSCAVVVFGKSVAKIKIQQHKFSLEFELCEKLFSWTSLQHFLGLLLNLIRPIVLSVISWTLEAERFLSSGFPNL